MLNFEDLLRADLEKLKNSVDKHDGNIDDRLDELESRVDDIMDELSEMKELMKSVYNLVDKVDDRLRWNQITEWRVNYNDGV